MKQKICPYPYIKPENDKRRKLSLRDVNEMKRLYAKGWKMVELSKLYLVADRTVAYHVDPKVKPLRLMYSRRYQQKLSRDPERKKAKNEATRQWRYLRLQEPAFKKYNRCWVARYRQKKK